MLEGTYGDGVGDLADDALVGSVGVGGRHVDGWVGGLFGFESVFELIDECECVECGREQGGGEVNKGLEGQLVDVGGAVAGPVSAAFQPTCVVKSISDHVNVTWV